MAKDKGERLEHAHNEGQEDYAKGEYNPKSSDFGAVTQDDCDIANAYRQGWQNARDQDKDD